jgi:hypothetical protein
MTKGGSDERESFLYTASFMFVCLIGKMNQGKRSGMDWIAWRIYSGRFNEKAGDFLHAEEIKLLISNMLIEVIETYIPHKWVDTVEPFMNRYNGRISCDYSGEVKEMTQEEFKEILLTLGKSEMPLFYLPLLDELLSNIYIDQWVPTYVSNYGKHWVSYKDLLEEKFRE